MVVSPDNPASPDEFVRASLAAAARRRRVREAARQGWRVAPPLAGGVAVLAAIGRVAGWSPALSLSLVIAAAAGLVLFVWAARRGGTISDAVAAAIDRDAGMLGELRSASWFARRDRRDEWSDFHLATTAARLRSVDWGALYPMPRPGRAQLVTVFLTAVAVFLAGTTRERATVAANGTALGREGPAAAPAGQLTAGPLDPELQRLLNELLASAAAGTLPSADALATNTEVRDLLNRLGKMNDPELLEALKRSLAADPNLQPKAAAENLKTLAEGARKAEAAGQLSAEMQDALEKLSDQLELAQPEAGDQAAGSPAGAEGDAPPNAANGAGASEEISIQFAKEAESSGGASMLMLSSQDAQQPGGAPGAGVGGAGSQDGAASAAAIAAALQQETLDASQDAAGENVETEIQRKTERGNATVAFTRGGTANFDRARASTPPPIPEARRPGVGTYFVRKPQ